MDQAQDKVLVNLDEYKEFIISQYENGKTKKTLVQEIIDLRKEKAVVESSVIEFKKHLESKKEEIIDLVFKSDNMPYTSREKHLDLDNRYNSYKGVETDDQKKLEALGITKEEIINYINKQWDKKEADEAAEKAGEESE